MPTDDKLPPGTPYWHRSNLVAYAVLLVCLFIFSVEHCS